MSREDQLAILRDDKKNVVDRLRAGASLELVYWDQRTDPPNLSREEFIKALAFMPVVSAKWDQRVSKAGKYGETGEDQVFDFEYSVTLGRFVYTYYVKGFFFEKSELKGVEIQSFRLVRKQNKSRGLRLV